jgi:hypothetical protein
MPFQEFLRQFRALLLPGAGNPDDPVARVKNALSYVFGRTRKQLDTFRPTRLETRDFIDYLLSAINQEEKALSPDRKAALTKILAYNETPGKSCFAEIDPHVFAFQLALRIREPSLMNQQDAGVCGEASLMMFVAKDTPSVFADYAISLMRNGWGKLHNLTIEPSNYTVSGWGPRRGMSEVDVVTMGSLGLSLVGFWEGRLAGTVCGWLRDAGFGNVIDKVIESRNEAKLRDNLAEAEKAIAAKKLVIFAIHTDLVEKLQKTKALLAQGSQKPHKSGAGMTSIVVTKSLEPAPSRVRRTDHWVLVSSVQIKAKTVTVKLYSWKDSMTGTFDISTFLTYYDGFIVAEPPKKTSSDHISTEDAPKKTSSEQISTEDESHENEWPDEE